MYSLITEKALNIIAQSTSSKLNPPFTESTDILRHELSEENLLVIYSKKDIKVGEYFILIKNEDLNQLPDTAAHDTFIRLARSLQASTRVPVRLPPTWSEYHAGSLVSFFAIPRDMGSYRWVAEIRNEEHALFFHTITSRVKITLEDYSIPTVQINCREILDEIIKSNICTENINSGSAIAPKIDLQILGSTAISQDKTFDSWDRYLSPEQKKIIYDYYHKSIRLVGPAGSGKTLSLCLKAIHDSRKNGSGSHEKIIFITHSWAMAERIDSTLSVLNNRTPHNIIVLPLLEILRDILNKQNIAIDILGEDSTDGRQQQINLIDLWVSAFANNKNSINNIDSLHPISKNIKDAIISDKNSSAHRELIENIYLEINGSLSSEGVLPNNRSRISAYLDGKGRSEFQPPFNSVGDRLFIIEIYKKFISDLYDLSYITTDQLVSDAIAIMETFSWSAKRKIEGYSTIFIDELQYFNSQERYAITLLSSDTSDTAFVTAEDPQQGIFSFISKDRNENQLVKSDLPPIELKESHRFRGGIFNFIKYLYSQFPLNSISLNYCKIDEDTRAEMPTLYLERNYKNSIVKAVNLAKRYAKTMNSEERLAIICIGDSAIDDIKEKLNGLQHTLIYSLDDTEKLNYTKRSISVGSWRYLGGLQFTHVIILWPTGSLATSPFSNIIELTSIYIASSRASHTLDIVMSGEIHQTLQNAIDRSYLRICDK